MTFGLQVTGSHGDLTIDDSYRNIMFISQGSCNTTHIDITFPSQGTFAPQIYVRPWADGHYVGACLFGEINAFGSPTSVRLLTNKLVRTPGVNGGNPVDQGNIGFDYVVYGVNGINAIDGSTYGMKVWDAAGNVSFDSRYEQARVQEVVLINQAGLAYPNMTYPRTYNYTSWGKRPWININPFGYCLAAESDEYGFFVTTSGLNAITVMLCGFITGIPSIGIDYLYDARYGIVVPFPGNYADIGLVQRYID